MEIQQSFPGSFGELLKTFRKRRRLTQKHLAQRFGVHMNTISSWELGTYLPAARGQVLELARCLALSELETRHLLEASLTALAPHWSVPFRRNSFFTGREEILETLHTHLSTGQVVALTQTYAVQGLGGIGKTQIALEYAYRHALEYSAVFWIEAETDETAISSLLRIAEVLQLPEREVPDQQRVVAAVQRWLSSHSGWLLIWDNLEDLDLLPRLLPAVRQGAILLTTRCQALGTLARGMDLAPMAQEEGMLFVLRRAKMLEPEATHEQLRRFAVNMPSEYAAATELVTALAGLPLALDQAGAYIDETGCNLVNYLQRYRQQHTHLLARRGGPGSDHPQSVTTTFRLAMKRVEGKRRAVADLLCACAFLHAEAIPEELFLTGAPHLGPALEPLATNPSLLDQILATLRSFSLVQRHPETQTLSIHRLVQAVLYERMSRLEQETWLKRVSAALCAVFPEISHEAWEQCERLLPHVLAVAAATADDLADQPLAEVLRKAADYLRDRAQYEQAEQLYQRALRLLEQAFGLEHPEVALCVDGLAILSFRQGKYEQAELLYRRALQIWEQTLGPTDLKVTRPLYGLARLKLRQGKYEQAEPLYRRALQIWEQALGPEHPEVAKPLDGLAILSLRQGKYAQAESLYRRALQIWEQALGPQHPLVAHALIGLGDIAYEQERYEQAEPLYQRTLQIWEQALGLEHPEVAYAHLCLADLSNKQGKYEQAELLYRQALQIWEQATGPGYSEIAFPLNGLANLYLSQGKYEEAAPLYEQALRLREQHLGRTHPETAGTLHDLALFHQKQGHWREALSLAERALQICSQSLGDTHPKTIASRALCAQIEEEREIVRDEEPFPRRGEEHPDHIRLAYLREETVLTPQETSDGSPSENDPLQEFLVACCELHPLAWCRIGDLWHTYEHWTATEQGRVPLSRRAFAAQLKARWCQTDRTNKTRIWRGIRLVNNHR
jgi:tetratricopeptide (TPR) repeat protein/transcriptional regulator with XRE-family HTH domain